MDLRRGHLVEMPRLEFHEVEGMEVSNRLLFSSLPANYCKAYYLLEVFARDRGNGGVEAGAAGTRKVSGNIIYLLGIALGVLEMSEVEAAHAISLQLEEAWSYDGTTEVDGIHCITCVGGADVHDFAGITGHHESTVLRQLSSYADSTVGESRDVAGKRHVVKWVGMR